MSLLLEVELLLHRPSKMEFDHSDLAEVKSCSDLACTVDWLTEFVELVLL